MKSKTKPRGKRRTGGSTSAGAGKVPASAMGDFLFEIGCEELPAGMIAKASTEL